MNFGWGIKSGNLEPHKGMGSGNKSSKTPSLSSFPGVTPPHHAPARKDGTAVRLESQA